MRWLNSLVIFLGLLIVSCITLIGYGFYKKTQTPDWKLWQLLNEKSPEQILEKSSKSKSHSQPPISTHTSNFGHINLDLPNECEIKNVGSHDKTLYISIGPTGICQRIILLDLGNGKIKGTIKITK